MLRRNGGVKSMNDIEVLEELLKYKEWYKEHGGEDIGFREIKQ